MIEEICDMLEIAKSTYFKHKKEDRLIISFMEKYFNEAELQEYLETKKIKKLDLIKDYTLEELENKLSSGARKVENEDFLLNLVNFKMYSYFKEREGIKDKIFKKLLDKTTTLKDVDGSKDYLLSIIEQYETSIFKAEHSNHKKIVLEFVKNYLSDLEVFVLINNKHKFFNA